MRLHMKITGVKACLDTTQYQLLYNSPFFLIHKDTHPYWYKPCSTKLKLFGKLKNFKFQIKNGTIVSLINNINCYFQ